MTLGGGVGLESLGAHWRVTDGLADASDPVVVVLAALTPVPPRWAASAWRCAGTRSHRGVASAVASEVVLQGL